MPKLILEQALRPDVKEQLRSYWPARWDAEDLIFALQELGPDHFLAAYQQTPKEKSND